MKPFYLTILAVVLSFSVFAIGPIVAPATICMGASTTLSCTGAGAGTWSTTSPVASISPGTGVFTAGVVASATAAAVSFTDGVSVVSATITILPAPGPIAGPSTVCNSVLGTPFSDDVAGGTWTSSNLSVATINTSTGVFYPSLLYSSTGPVTITYAQTCGIVTKTVTLVQSPAAYTYSVTGGGSYCAGGTGIPIGTGNSELGVNYQLYVGAIPVGAIVAGTNGPLDFGPQTTAGVYTVYAVHSATGCGTQVSGSVTITPNPLPTAYSVTGGGVYCSGGSGVTIDLPGSEAGINYALYRGSTLVTTVAGTGAAISFGLQAAAGSYSVRATNPATTCVRHFPGGVNVTIDPLPVAYAVTGGGVYCPGSPGGGISVGLVASNPAISYFLYGPSGLVGTPIASTGGPITFPVSAAGTYSVQAVSMVTGCANWMSGTAVVTTGPTIAPITGSSSLCTSSCTQLSCSTPGGTWSAGNTSVATISSTGLLCGTGISPGLVPIFYSLGGCTNTTTVTVGVAPSPIIGPVTMCVSSCIQLSNTTAGGTWSSSASAIAPVSPTGSVCGSVPGTVVITYGFPAGCSTTSTVTVNPAASPILGSTSLCAGSCTQLSNTAPGGLWSSSNFTVASVNSSTGLICGGPNPGGTANITYTLPTGCIATSSIVVNPIPSVIVGNTTACVNVPTQLSCATPGGVWSSSNPLVATVTPTGLALGTSPGVVVVTYSTGLCSSTFTLTINSVPPAIVGPSAICTGSTAAMTDATPGGVWSASNTAVFTVHPTTAVATAVTTGTGLIVYTLPSGCATTKTVQVIPNPGPITGSTSICNGGSTQLSNATPGGTWSSSISTIATVNASTGEVHSNSFGIVNISYTLITGCIASTTVVVNPTPFPIIGPATLCSGSTAFLSTVTTGGAWSVSNTNVATIAFIGPTVSLVGATTGVTNVSYTLSTGCAAVKSVTVTIQPAATIGAPLAICQFQIAQLSNATPGGIWSISNSTLATISASGQVGGVAVGSAQMSYSIGSCHSISPLMVKLQPGAISGASDLCLGSSTTLSNGTPLGIWSSGNTSIATISSTAGMVSTGSAGMTTGVTPITYTLNGCFSTKTLTVNTQPGPIQGITSFCSLSSTTLSNTTPGGMWSSSNSTIIIDAMGVVTATMPATSIVTYSMPVTGCLAAKMVQAITVPTSITGPSTFCAGSNAPLGNTTLGGTWSSSNIAVATVGVANGVVYALTAGSANISYSLPGGCATSYAITVQPTASITGPSAICNGSLAQLSASVAGGTWTSSNFSIAAVGVSTGIVSAVAVGSAVILYSNGVCSATHPINVIPTPTITGPSSVCDHMTTALSSATPGGSWSCSNIAMATVSSAGMVTGTSPGVVNISYTVGSGCSAVMSFTVHPLAPTTGINTICAGSSTTLSNTVAGGAWISSNPGVASVSPFTPVVQGISGGTAVISYSLPTGCTSTMSVTVNPTPIIVGPASMCAGASVAFSSNYGGGTWSSGNLAITAISATGVAIGISAGVTNISYALLAGCGATAAIEVHPAPSAITGLAPLCIGSTIALSSTLSGGSWSATPTLVATIDASGTLFGISAGTAFATYTSPFGCAISSSLLVGALPTVNVVITPSTTFCVGDTTTFTANTAGGTSMAYQWFINGIMVSGATGVTFVNANLNPNDSVSVQVTMTASCDGSVVMLPGYTPITVHPLPTVTASSTASGCGGSYNLNATGTGVSYLWSPTAGLSCSACAAPMAAISASTSYTVITTDANGCTASDGITLDGNRISGYINYTGVATDSFRVWLISYNPVDSTVTALDSTVSCMDGGIPYYEFINPAAGSYMVKAKLFGTIPGTSGYIPTYGLSSPNWFGAATVTHTVNTDNQPITMIYGTVPAGPGFIAGNVYSGAGRGTSGDAPVEGMVVYLRNTTTQVLTYTYTTASGSYYFGDLAYGSYVIYPEEFDYYTTPSAVITLSPASPSATGINFKQHTDDGTITPMDATVVQSLEQQYAISVYPNPAQNEITLQWKGMPTGTADLIIGDAVGRTVLQKSLAVNALPGSRAIDISGLEAGTYTIHIICKSIDYTQILTIRK